MLNRHDHTYRVFVGDLQNAVDFCNKRLLCWGVYYVLLKRCARSFVWLVFFCVEIAQVLRDEKGVRSRLPKRYLLDILWL